MASFQRGKVSCVGRAHRYINRKTFKLKQIHRKSPISFAWYVQLCNFFIFSIFSQRVSTPENGSSMPIILIVFLSHQIPCFETEKDISFAIVPLSSKILHQLPTRMTWGHPFIRLWGWKKCNLLVLLLPVMHWIRAYLTLTLGESTQYVQWNEWARYELHYRLQARWAVKA